VYEVASIRLNGYHGSKAKSHFKGAPKIRPYSISKGEKTYYYYNVTYSAIDGQRERKSFTLEAEARHFMSLKEIEILNGGHLKSVATRLSDSQVSEAESAIKRLSGHTLTEVVDYFIKYYQPEFEPCGLGCAVDFFLAQKKKDGIRERSLYQLERSMDSFLTYTGKSIEVHQIDADHCRSYIETKSQMPKTYNNVRADLHNFFNFCIEPDRRWIKSNPAIFIKKKKVLRGMPSTLDASKSEALMRHVESYKDGCLVPYFALCLFAGLRPEGEVKKLAVRLDIKKLIDFENDVIHILPEISKTGQYRQAMIRPGLKAYLQKYTGPILPMGFERDIKRIRKEMNLSHDVMRHTFYSMHIATYESVGKAAIEGGSTEYIIKRHYLNQSNMKEGKQFWQIRPSLTL